MAVVFGLAGLAVALAGCSQEPAPREDQLARGLVLVLPGVESTRFSTWGLIGGLRDAGLEQAIQFDGWGVRPLGTFPNLRSYQLNRERAAARAVRLGAYAAKYPGRPISIVGYSGGAAIAVWTAEALPEGVMLDRIVLLGAALSPGYDLAPAAARSRRGLVSFYSPRDRLMCCWGTQTFGTMDRIKVESAGAVGFQDPDGRLLEFPGVTQIAWDSSWWRMGHLGGHSGWRARAWSREILAPFLELEPSSRPALAAG